MTKGSTQFCINLRKLQIMRSLYCTFPQYASDFYEGVFLFQLREYPKNFYVVSLGGKIISETWITNLIHGSTLSHAVDIKSLWAAD